MVGCLWLQCALWGIKCHQGSKRQREPITIELMHIIFQSLNFCNHTILWDTCCLRLFGFLHAVEFTVNSHFNPNIHIAVSDVQAESLVNPGSFRIYINNIKCSKTDPFCQGCYKLSTLGLENVISDPCSPLSSIYMSMAQLLAHFSFFLMAPL